jgi:hypothetical protein
MNSNENSLSLDCEVKRMFKRKTKLEKVLDKRINYVTFRDFLKSLSHKELHILAEEIIWKEYEYNGLSCYMEQNYYDLMDRRQKEFYIEDREYLLLQ